MEQRNSSDMCDTEKCLLYDDLEAITGMWVGGNKGFRGEMHGFLKALSG